MEGRRNGHGGKYICGVTGICFEGQWDTGKVILPPSRWAIELDNEEERVGVDGSGANHAKNKLPGGAKGDKGSKGVKGKTKGAKQQDEGDGVDGPVIARYGSDGAVVGLWCRSVRDEKVKRITLILCCSGGKCFGCRLVLARCYFPGTEMQSNRWVVLAPKVFYGQGLRPRDDPQIPTKIFPPTPRTARASTAANARKKGRRGRVAPTGQKAFVSDYCV